MTTDDIVAIALRSISFKHFQQQLERWSKQEAEKAEAQRKYVAEAWRHFDANKG